ncbi:hypothetical protein J6590_026477 [Homalodisca vitripennis]|nr:hypothetical protein J6590_026477 [Homalodisca vitripennis]
MAQQGLRAREKVGSMSRAGYIRFLHANSVAQQGLIARGQVGLMSRAGFIRFLHAHNVAQVGTMNDRLSSKGKSRVNEPSWFHKISACTQRGSAFSSELEQTCQVSSPAVISYLRELLSGALDGLPGVWQTPNITDYRQHLPLGNPSSQTLTASSSN